MRFISWNVNGLRACVGKDGEKVEDGIIGFQTAFMEFEVVFFYDLDIALQGDDNELMNRYLYVGISRATSHLAATLTKRNGNESIIKYFDSESKDWKM